MESHYDRQTATFLTVVAQNMPTVSGRGMQYWIERPKEVAAILRAFLITVWRIIRLGAYKSSDDLWAAVRKAHVEEGGHDALELLDRALRLDFGDGPLPVLPVASVGTTVKLVIMTPGDLGCKHRGTGDPDFVQYDDICHRAQELALQLCPAEVGPLLYLQHAKFLPLGDRLIIAMESLPGIKTRHIFCVERHQTDTHFGTEDVPNGFLYSAKFVFVAPKK